MVLPDLGLLQEQDEPAFEEVKRALGVGTVIYHVVAQPGAGAVGRTTRRTSAPGWPTATPPRPATSRRSAPGPAAARRWSTSWPALRIAGLPHAQALLARAIAPYDEGVREACELATPDPDAVRKAVLTAVGGRTQWTARGAAAS